MRFSLIILALLIFNASNVNAGICVNYTGEKVDSINKRTTGSKCSGDYYTNEDAEFSQIKDLPTSVKFLKMSGGIPVEMTQAEKDVIIAADQVKVDDAKKASINDLDISTKEAFAAWLTVYNSKVPAQYQVTGKELKDQVKIDLGLN